MPTMLSIRKLSGQISGDQGSINPSVMLISIQMEVDFFKKKFTFLYNKKKCILKATDNLDAELTLLDPAHIREHMHSLQNQS
jgi:hypothetical protein